MKSYTLLLCPTETGRELYRNFPEIHSNANAGIDLFVAETYEFSAQKYKEGQQPLYHLLDLGVRAVMVENQTGEQVHYTLEPRSSIFKSGFMMANSRGIIDRSYRGPLKAPIVPQDPTTNTSLRIEPGQRLFQIVAPDLGWIHRVQIVDSLDTTARGEGGFGSTGR